MTQSREMKPEPRTPATRMPATGAAEPQDAGGEPAADTAQLRALRIAVIVMSLLLVVGFVTVIARIIYLASRSSAQPSAAAVTALTPSSALALKPEVALPLPPGAAIAGTSLDGARLTVTYTAPTGGGIVILDLETGRVLSRIRPATEPAR